MCIVHYREKNIGEIPVPKSLQQRRNKTREKRMGPGKGKWIWSILKWHLDVEFGGEKNDRETETQLQY